MIGLSTRSSSEARVASASASAHSPVSVASSARLIRQMAGNGDPGGRDSHHAREASAHSPARRTSASSRHSLRTLQYTMPVKYVVSSPATTEVMASSSSATPSATRPWAMSAWPSRWMPIATMSGSESRVPISTARRASVSAPSNSPPKRANVDSRQASKPCWRASGRSRRWRCARMSQPAPTAPSPRWKRSMAMRAATPPASRFSPRAA